MQGMSAFSRGAQLLIEWRGDRTQAVACAIVKLDPAIYCAFEKGRKTPGFKRAKLIEDGTGGAVPMQAWAQPPKVERKAKRAA